MNSQQFKKIKMPDYPGVYFFYKGKSIIYIGKATSLRDRVKSYFGKDLIAARGPLILDMATVATSIKWQETDSVLEALILEANFIKKYQPKYNTKEKDNKSFNYVCITDEKIPKVLVIRGRNLQKEKCQNIFGPFPNGSQLREAMKIVRRIFPYLDEDSLKKNNVEFYKQLGLIPEIIISQKNSFQKVLGSPRQILLEARPDHFEKDFSAPLSNYKDNIKNLRLFFEGKKKSVILNLKREMTAFSKSRDFENAARVRNQIFALNHINDVALIKGDITQENNLKKISSYRIEAYDVAHMAGKNMVGVMTVIENKRLTKNEYKKFIVRTQERSNDTGALEEILSRRLRHIEWGLPNLIVVDGSVAQINITKSVLNRYQFKIPAVSVVKDDKHKAKAIMGDELIIKEYKKEILLINSEAHRFAIAFHKLKRSKDFLGK